ncbi:MAG TPA: EamA family transporter, partial [Sulfuricella sp.]|nr:EamA family transporter [Sulfuricella sp.]
MVVAGFLFGCMSVFVKLGSTYFSSAELVFYRS